MYWLGHRMSLWKVIQRLCVGYLWVAIPMPNQHLSLKPYHRSYYTSISSTYVLSVMFITGEKEGLNYAPLLE